MRFSNKFFAVVLGLWVSANTWAVGVSVGRSILDGLSTETSNILKSKGLTTSQKDVWASFDRAIIQLNRDAKPATEEALRSLVGNNKELAAILAKDLKDATPAEISALHNHFAENATKIKTGKAFVGCSGCLAADATTAGWKISGLAREVSADTGKILSQAKAGSALQKDLVQLGGTMKLRGIDASGLAKLSETERQQLFVALKKASKGTDSEKKLGKAIERFSTSQSDGYLEPKLWMLLAEDLDQPNMDRMTTLLNRISAQEADSEANRVSNLRKWFEDNADTRELKDALDNLKAKNCWGIF